MAYYPRLRSDEVLDLMTKIEGIDSVSIYLAIYTS